MRSVRWTVAAITALTASATVGAEGRGDPAVAKLALEVRGRGWILYGALTPKGDMDLFLMRPDGSAQRNITNTPDQHEGAPRFSPDGRRVLYRRISRKQRVHHNRWGYQGYVVVANVDGSNPQVKGEQGGLPWASWSPDSKYVSCLTRKGIQIIDPETMRVVRQLPRKGIYQQLFWSPDGKWFCGVSNAFGQYWTVVRMNAETGEVNPVGKLASAASKRPASRGQRTRSGAECTPDWFPDSKHILLSYNPAGEQNWTQLWMVDGDGKNPRLVYGQDGRHIYGGTLSPDGKYVLFSRVLLDGAGGLISATNMGLIRFEDTPTVGGKSEALRKQHPEAKDAPILDLPVGYEPDWTYVDVTSKQR